jgi:hypothetical protein
MHPAPPPPPPGRPPVLPLPPCSTGPGHANKTAARRTCTVDSLCATNTAVRPAASALSEAWMPRSVAVSRAEVASSQISRRGRLRGGGSAGSADGWLGEGMGGGWMQRLGWGGTQQQCGTKPRPCAKVWVQSVSRQEVASAAAGSSSGVCGWRSV